jgi:hypothetical protein
MDFLLAALARGWRRRTDFETFSFFYFLNKANTHGARAQLYLRTEVVQN